MEGDLTAAPRLASDFYAQNGWPLIGATFEGTPAQTVQAPLLVAEINLPKFAFDPINGLAGPYAAEINLQAINHSPASAQADGQAGVGNEASGQTQASINADRVLHPAIAVGEEERTILLHASINEANDPPRDGHSYGVSDRAQASRYAPLTALLQTRITLLAALEPIEGQANLCLFPTASTPVPASLADPYLLLTFMVANPPSPTRITSSRYPAILVLLLFVEGYMQPLQPLPKQSLVPLDRNRKLLWKPGNPTLPSILVGDFPLSPMLLVSQPVATTPKNSLLLSVPPRQSLAPLPPAATLGYEQPECCSYCGNWVHSNRCGSTSTALFGFSHLRGRNVGEQAQESKATIHHHVVDPAQRSARPRCKMKSELKGFRTHKATSDPR